MEDDAKTVFAYTYIAYINLYNYMYSSTSSQREGQWLTYMQKNIHYIVGVVVSVITMAIDTYLIIITMAIHTLLLLPWRYIPYYYYHGDTYLIIITMAIHTLLLLPCGLSVTTPLTLIILSILTLSMASSSS